MNKVYFRIALLSILLVLTWIFFPSSGGTAQALLILLLLFSLWITLKIFAKEKNMIYFPANSKRVYKFLSITNKIVFFGIMLSMIIFKITEQSGITFFILLTLMGISLLNLIFFSSNVLVIGNSGLRYPFRWKMPWNEIVSFRLNVRENSILFESASDIKILYFDAPQYLEEVKVAIESFKK